MRKAIFMIGLGICLVSMLVFIAPLQEAYADEVKGKKQENTTDDIAAVYRAFLIIDELEEGMVCQQLLDSLDEQGVTYRVDIVSVTDEIQGQTHYSDHVMLMLSEYVLVDLIVEKEDVRIGFGIPAKRDNEEVFEGEIVKAQIVVASPEEERDGAWNYRWTVDSNGVLSPEEQIGVPAISVVYFDVKTKLTEDEYIREFHLTPNPVEFWRMKK